MGCGESASRAGAWPHVICCAAQRFERAQKGSDLCGGRCALCLLGLLGQWRGARVVTALTHSGCRGGVGLARRLHAVLRARAAVLARRSSPIGGAGKCIEGLEERALAWTEGVLHQREERVDGTRIGWAVAHARKWLRRPLGAHAGHCQRRPQRQVVGVEDDRPIIRGGTHQI